MQDFNNKFLEFAHANTNAAFDFVQRLHGVKSPSEVMELSTEHTRNQIQAVTEQTKQLVEYAQKAVLATAEPLKMGVTKVFNHPCHVTSGVLHFVSRISSHRPNLIRGSGPPIAPCPSRRWRLQTARLRRENSHPLFQELHVCFLSRDGIVTTR